MFDMVGSVTNTASCTNSCRVACQAGDDTAQSACSSGDTLVCMGSNLDKFVGINKESSGHATTVITNLESLVNGVLPGFSPFTVSHNMNTMTTSLPDALPMQTQAFDAAGHKMKPMWDFGNLISGVSSAVNEAVGSLQGNGVFPTISSGANTGTNNQFSGANALNPSTGMSTANGARKTTTNRAAVTALSSLPTLASLFSYQTSNAQAIASAAALQDIVWAARNAYGVAVPTERWLASEADSIATASREMSTKANTFSFASPFDPVSNGMPSGVTAVPGGTGTGVTVTGSGSPRTAAGSSSSAVVASLTQLVQSLGTVAQVSKGGVANRVSVFAPGAALYNALSLLQL